MRRRDLIPLLLDRTWPVTALARELRCTPPELANDLEHLVLSLRHMDYKAEITPARCRKCGFEFGPDKLLKPSKCPRCRGTWIAEARVGVRQKTVEGLPRLDVDPGDPPAWLEELDHTADTGIGVTAPDLPTLFNRAAWGMFSVITDLANVVPATSAEVVVEADDLPALLVRWLSELNFRHVTRHELYCRFQIVEFAPNRLRAEVAGEPIVAGRHTVFTEIKAVTFHSLELAEVDGGWRAQIIFDL